MRALVTGVAGFIGSTLAEQLLAAGHDVRGVDCFSDYYDPKIKRGNVERFSGRPGFELIEADLRSVDLGPHVHDRDVVFHQAAQPGVRLSWSTGFAEYDSNNVLATQRLLEAVKDTSIRRFVYASSSSVYGNARRYPTEETDLPRPHSPYGVTKLAGEHLCVLYAENWGVPTVALRYFTVYGPRQRPDMAIHRLLRSALTGEEFVIYGDGAQRRDFTNVHDVVRANLSAADAPLDPGSVINIAGGSSVTVNELIEGASEAAGRPINVARGPAQPGDVAITGGSTAEAKRLLGWAPTISLGDGLVAQAQWQRELLEGDA
jgi:nucleoside-diphosphate-sugar epimerase